MNDLFGHKPLTRKSPLPYPGGKSCGKKLILPYFPKTREIVSPFCGGCSIELELASQGIKVHAYDLFFDLINFWQQLQKDPLTIWEKGSLYLKEEEFYQNLANLNKEKDLVEKAALFYGVRKSSYGSLGMSVKRAHEKITKLTKFSPSVLKLKTFYNPNITFQCADFEVALSNHNCFASLAPPYMIESNLYGKKGELHKQFDHERLASVLRARDNWVLSYNNCDEVKNMYSGYRFEYPKFKQTLGKFSYGKEILIINT